jgi:hypothetical protein
MMLVRRTLVNPRIGDDERAKKSRAQKSPA